MPNKDRWVHSKCMKLYLQVNKVEPPIRGVAGGIDHHQQGILEAVDWLAVVGILCRRVDAAVASERRSCTTELQLHSV